MDFRCQNAMPEMVKVVFVRHACCNLRGWGGSRNLMKNGCPKDTNKSSKLSPWAPMVEFFEILCGFERMCFLISFWLGKNQPQISNIGGFGREEGVWMIFSEGSAVADPPPSATPLCITPLLCPSATPLCKSLCFSSLYCRRSSPPLCTLFPKFWLGF